MNNKILLVLLAILLCLFLTGCTGPDEDEINSMIMGVAAGGFILSAITLLLIGPIIKFLHADKLPILNRIAKRKIRISDLGFSALIIIVLHILTYLIVPNAGIEEGVGMGILWATIVSWVAILYTLAAMIFLPDKYLKYFPAALAGITYVAMIAASISSSFGFLLGFVIAMWLLPFLAIFSLFNLV